MRRGGGSRRAKEVYEETAGPIPDCTLRMYEGVGHVGAVMDRRFPRDVLDFVRQRAAPADGAAREPEAADRLAAAGGL